MKIFSNSLASKLFVANALIILAALAVTGLNGYFQSKRVIDKSVLSHALGVLGERRARIQAWQDELRRDFALFTALPELTTVELNSLIKVHLRSNKSFIYCAVLDKDGSVISSAGNYSDLSEVASLPAFRSALDGYYTVGAIHLGANNSSILNIAAPIQDKSGDSSRVYLCQLLVSLSIEPILADTIGFGYSGESFLVGADTVMLTPSRFHYHPDPLTHKMPVPSVLKALEGESGVSIYTNFLGYKVVGAYAYLPDFDWILITEMVTEEAFAPLKTIARNIVIVAIMALLFLLVFALFISQTWTKPIERLADASLKVADEDFSILVAEDERTDEIGTLTSQFNRMIVSIRESHEKLKLSHARLLQAQKMATIGELASGIVHEMRNPLSVIKMNLRFLQRKPDHDPQKDPITSEQIELATMEANRLERMLAELLDYSKPIELQYEIIPAHELAQRSIETVKDICTQTGIEIEVDLDKNEDTLVWADKDLIIRVLSNLLLNSIQASQTGSTVVLKVVEVSGGTQIEIIDKGMGMKQAVLDRLFELFFTTREGGTGLGMPNVKKIVEAHGGSIEVISEENKGTTVKVLLPKET
ncbi:MAG: sensor histidine kinase [Calditrichaeota bacterium]|nr:sensor histidine kinase [Calditrichota bacterium]